MYNTDIQVHSVDDFILTYLESEITSPEQGK
jgi:hypothetical protein